MVYARAAKRRLFSPSVWEGNRQGNGLVLVTGTIYENVMKLGIQKK